MTELNLDFCLLIRFSFMSLQQMDTPKSLNIYWKIMQPLMQLTEIYGHQRMQLHVGVMYVHSGRERGKNLSFPSSYSHTHTHKLKISTHPTVISSHVQRIKTVSVDLFQMEILEMLAMSGADLNAKNKNDETPSGKSSILWLYTRTTHSSSYLILTLST